MTPVRCLATAFVLASIGACVRDEHAAPKARAAADAPRDVATAVATAARWEHTVHATGELAPLEESTLATKVAGRLAEILVDLGQSVAAGETIARLDGRDFELRVEQARSAVEAASALLGLAPDRADAAVDPETTAQVVSARAEFTDAEREYARLAQLSTDHIATQAELDAAAMRRTSADSRLRSARDEIANRVATLKQRRAELALARQQLADATIVAPFAGICGARLADRGEYLAIGAPLVMLARLDPIRVRLRVPERDTPAVVAGAVVRVELADGAPQVGKLVRLAPELDPRSRTLLVEAELENHAGRLRAGSYVEGEIVVPEGAGNENGDAGAVTVPLDTLVRFAGVDRVFRVVDGKAVETRVVVGRVDRERAELVQGVGVGDVVVRDPGGLKSGAIVTVTSDSRATPR